jgi:predicted hydrocarbon binding protein
MGSNGVAAALRLAGLGRLIGRYPPDTLDREFRFGDFAAINQSIVEMYGPHVAKGLCLRAGRATLRNAVAEGGLMADLPDPAFKLLPDGAKVKVGLHTLAQVLSKLSDQDARLEERDGALFFVVERCPECWERTSDEAICHGTTGMLLEALDWLTDGKKYTVTETACMARGDLACVFEIGPGQEEAVIEEPEGTASDTAGTRTQ